MYDVVGIGECLIDFTPFKEQPNGFPVFEQNPGGAPANMVAAAAAMGARVAFIGKVGCDPFGRFLAQQLQKVSIDIQGLVLSGAHTTTLAFVHLESDGQREFEFIRDADTMLRPEDVNWELVRNTKVLHVSSLAFSGSETADTTLQVVQAAKEAGALVSYDANWRPMLWDDIDVGKKSLAIGAGFADILKVSEEELVYITGIEAEEEAIATLLGQGVGMIMVTKGANGTSVYTRNACTDYPAYEQNKAVDTTGAGDACFGSFVQAFLASGKSIDALTDEDLRDYQKSANAVAGLSVTRRGGLSSIPSRREVLSFLEQQ